MSWLLISQIIVSALAFFWTILITRYLGVQRYGILGFATSTVGMVGVLMDLGMSAYIVRHIATNNDSVSKYLGNAIPLKLMLFVGTFAFLLVCLILMKCDELTITITLLFLIEGIFQTTINLINGAFLAFEKAKYQGIGTVLINVLLFLFILLTIFTDLGLYGIAISYIIANIIGLIYEYYTLNKRIAKPKFELDKSLYKKLLLSGLPFAITGILSSVYYSIDVIMLTTMVGNYATGLYNATYKLIGVLTLFYSVYSSVIYPVMSKFFKNDKRSLVVIYEKSIKYLMLIIIPLAVATTYYSLDIIHFIYGAEYDPSAPILSILIWTVCLLFANGAGNSLLTASHKERTVTKIYALAAGFNVVANLILIPYLSYIGAAITTVLSDILIFIIQKYVIHKIGSKPNKKLYYDLVKIITGSLVLGIALYFLKLNMWVAIPVGIIIYFATICLLKLFDDNDKFIIKEILGKNN